MGLSRGPKEPKPEETAEAKMSEWLVSDEHSNVEKWRLHVLMEAGYSLGVAQRLAMSVGVDLHVACEILKEGCSEATAAEILL